MTSRLALTVAVLACLACPALAQTADATVSSSAASVAPGGTVTVTLTVDYNVGGAGGGVFGSAGFYGFGGNLTVSGDGAADVSPSAVNVDGQLAFGLTTSTPGGTILVRAAAGRGLDGGLAGSSLAALTFDLTADPGATEGTSVTIDYDGAAVLVEGSSLVTYATQPGLNQQMLGTTAVTITIGDSGCNDADLTEPFGVLDLNDISAFVGAFTTQDSLGDINDDGVYDLTDISLFVGAFTAGCP